MTREPEPSSPAQTSEPDALTELLDKPFAETDTSTAPAPPAALAEFAAPDNCRKLLHRWRDRQRLPDVQEL